MTHGGLKRATSGTRTRVVDGRELVVADVDIIIPFAPDREIWEKQPGESDRAWAGFEAYRLLPPRLRTYAAAHRQLNNLEDAAGVYTTNMAHWAKRNRWAERIAAFDNWVAAQELEVLVQDRIEARKETATLGKLLRTRAAEAAEVLLTTLFVTIEDPVTGQQTKVARSSLTPNEIARLADIGSKLERFALDLDSTDHRGEPKDDTGLALTVNFFQQGGEQQVLAEAAAILKAQEEQADVIEGIAELVNQPAAEVAAGSSGGVQ